MISLIERKMSEDHLRVWARYLNSEKCEPSMDNLLSWMEAEMTARMRSGAQIRKNVGSNRVHAFGSSNENGGRKNGDDRFKSKQCYVCQGRQYVDECQRFSDMTPKERSKSVFFLFKTQQRSRRCQLSTKERVWRETPVRLCLQQT